MQFVIFLYFCFFSFIYSSTLDRYDEIKAKDFHLIDSEGNIIISFSEFDVSQFDSLFSMIKINIDLIKKNQDLINSNQNQIYRVQTETIANELKIKDLDQNTSSIFNSDIHRNTTKILQIEKILLDIQSKLYNEEKTDKTEFVKYSKNPRAIVSVQENLQYPKYAKKRGVEGTVFVKFYIDNKGNVDPNKITIIEGIPELNNAAIEAVKKSVWHPAEHEDMKVGVYLSMPINFELK
tara:strand:- start:24 stop:731 length:708 start_codon:yes stop_codon:yes gene_type:complete